MKWYIHVLRNYANFHGRARRKEYWYFVLFHLIFIILSSLIADAMNSQLVYAIYILALFIPTMAVSVRRMHDINKSGWFILIPIYNLILYCTPGTRGENKYGPDPTGEGPVFEFEQEAPQR